MPYTIRDWLNENYKRTEVQKIIFFYIIPLSWRLLYSDPQKQKNLKGPLKTIKNIKKLSLLSAILFFKTNKC